MTLQTSDNRRALALRLPIALLAGFALTSAAAAADVSDNVLRSLVGDPPATQFATRWDGINFGGHYGFSNLNTNFGSGLSSEVAYILRNSTLQSEFSPSSWTALPSTTTNSQTYGGFFGYSTQYDSIVLGFDIGYNKARSLSTSGSDALTRIVTTSDSVQHTVTIAGTSSLRLLDYGTLRGRAGYAFGQFLPYGIAGVAIGRFNYSNSATVTDVQVSGGVTTTFGPVTQADAKDNAFAAGLVLGLGLDVSLLPNVFLRGEWEFVAFGPVGGIKTNINTARVGLGVRF